MTFRGWPKSALAFYEGLEADNSKAYWQAHKKTYDADVRGPMEELTADVEDEFGPAKIFRPFRDTRFSADKTPYKTNIAAAVGGMGKVAYYVSLSAEDVAIGGGLHEPTTEQLARQRAAIAEDRTGKALVELTTALRTAKFEIGWDAVKTAPRGYPVDHPRIELLRLKHLVAVQHHAPAPWLHTPKAKDRIVTAWRAIRPLNEWIERHIGAA